MGPYPTFAMSPDLSAQSIDAEVSGRLGRPLTFLETTDSTNERALELLATGAPEGSMVVADHQTTGRGRRGRSWESPPGSGLLFSLVLRPDTSEALEILTTALGVATAEAIEQATGVAAGLKWPNDVTVGGRKLAGILVESRLSGGTIEGAVAGMGVNVTWPSTDFDDDGLNATSIAALAARDATIAVPDRAVLLGAVVKRFELLYDDLTVAETRNDVVKRASDRSEVLGRDISVRFADGSSVEGRALDLTATGALRLETPGGAIKVLNVGETERLRPA